LDAHEAGAADEPLCVFAVVVAVVVFGSAVAS